MAIKYNPKNAISLKVSSIADFEIMKKLNVIQDHLNELTRSLDNSSTTNNVITNLLRVQYRYHLN